VSLAVEVTLQVVHEGGAIAHLIDRQHLVVGRRDDSLSLGTEELRVAISEEGIEPSYSYRREPSEVVGQRSGPAESSVEFVDLVHGDHNNRAKRTAYRHVAHMSRSAAVGLAGATDRSMGVERQ
jgi:hypothetical protein